MDNTKRGHNVIFAFYKNQEAETRMMIPALPLVLEEFLNDKAWDWFVKEAGLNVEGYLWDLDKGLVCTNEVARDKETAHC